MNSIGRRFAACVALALSVVVAAACGLANERPELARAIDSAVAQAGNGAVIDLGEVLALDWDTLYGFPGYTTNAEISAATGTDFGSSEDSLIPYDGRNLVVLTKTGKVAGWFILNRDDITVAVRFHDSLYGQPIRRADAVFTTFTREKTTGGFDLYYLLPPN